MENILNAIFTPTCFVCNSVGSVFCSYCLDMCDNVHEGICIICNTPSLEGNTHKTCFTKGSPFSFFSSYKYEKNVRQCIKKSKYGAKQFSALKVLTKAGVSWASRCGKRWDGCLVAPIPLNSKRARDRGFNQTELIATVVAQTLDLQTDFKILYRSKHTEAQHKNKREQRFKNLANAFSSDPKKVAGKKVLIVDDISTSGATLIEASKALYNANCSEVHCFTLAWRPFHSRTFNLIQQTI